MTDEIIQEMEAQADAQDDQYRIVRDACLFALVQQNYGKVMIRKEFMDKFLADELPAVEILLKTLEDGHYELSITDAVDRDAAIAAATH